MIKSHKSLLVLLVLLTGTLFVSTAPIQVASQGDVDPDLQAGDTYYYSVTSFPTFDEIFDLTGASDGFNSTHNVEVTGSLEGSEIYVKVMDVTEISGQYWDGNSLESGDIPTVDIAVGLITSSELTVDLTVDGELTTTVVPAGVGLPIPFLFGSSTMFNVSNWDYEGETNFIPVPFVLNDDYSLHETIFNQLGSQLNGAIDVTNDASQFAADFINVDVDPDASLRVDGLVSYNKSTGVLQELNFELTNFSTNDVLADVDIDLDRREFNGMQVAVGDTFELSLNNAGFDYSVDSSNTTLEDEIDTGLSWVKGNMTDNIGEVLIEFEVVEVRGLYYSVEGSVYDGNNGMNGFPTNQDNFEDLWFHSFGRFGPGMSLPNQDPGHTFYEILNPDNETVVTADRVPIRDRALPGPFTTADYRIFDAWDNTTAFLVGLINAELDTALGLIEDTNDVVFSSSTSNQLEASLGFSSESDLETYSGWELSADVDGKATIDQGGGDGPDNIDITVVADASVAVDYNQTVMAGVTFNGNADVNVTAYGDDGVVDQWIVVSISNFVVELSVDTTVEPAPLPGDGSDDDGGLGLPIPGFEFYISLISFFAIAIVVRLRSRR